MTSRLLTTCAMTVGLLCAGHAAHAAEPSAQAAATVTTKGLIDIANHKRPDGATQLVGDDRHIMVPESRRGVTQWTFADGVLTASSRGGDSVLTPAPYKDFVMHVEFNVPHDPGKPRANDGNSGVYLQKRYEVQILNSHGVTEDEYKEIDGASLYRFKKPDKLVARPAGQWQAYDIAFRAARFDGETKTENARITVYHNGVLIHDDVSMPDRTGHGLAEGPDAMPIRLQGHGSPVKFRNVWIKELDL